MIEHPEHMNYHKVMKAIDAYIEDLSEDRMELQNKMAGLEEQLGGLAKAKAFIDQVWLEDHPDTGGY